MTEDADRHLHGAAESLRQLLEDASIPPDVRTELMEEYRQVRAMAEKLEHGHLHLSVFGKVSVGKSSLLNALVGAETFSVSPLHGETKRSAMTTWSDATVSGVHLIDTPGINELDGEAREKLAYDVAGRSDLVIFVVEGDMTDTETDALQSVCARQRPVVLVLNKADRYSTTQLSQLLARLREHASGLVRPENIIAAAADPMPRIYVTVDENGEEHEERRDLPPDVARLKERIWEVLEAEGKTLAALNASLFAGELTDQVAEKIAAARRRIAEKIVRHYSLAKGVAVALNPVPVADLLAAAALDVALVKHLSQAYDLPMTRREAGKLITTIAAQLAALMGAVWGVHLVSSALKGMSAGLSTAITAGAQGALAYYATYLVGQAAEQYLIQGKSWGSGGAKRVVEDILKTVDRNSILVEARREILHRLRRAE